MSAYKWHKRYHDDFIAGVRRMDAEHIGVYTIILDLIYSQGAPIESDDKYIAGACGLGTARYRRIKNGLVERGKITEENGLIFNERARIELENSQKTREKLQGNGKKGGKKRAKNQARCNENNNLSQAGLKYKDKETEENKKVIPPSGTPYEEQDAKGEPDLFQPDSPEPEPAPPPETKPKAKRGTRLPENWAPSEADVEYARNLGMSDAEITDTAEEFRNYWIDVPGQRGVKLTWSGTFRNRCRTVVARASTGAVGGRRYTPRRSASDAARELLAEYAMEQRSSAGFGGTAGSPAASRFADLGVPIDDDGTEIEGEATVVALRPRLGHDASDGHVKIGARQ